MRKFNQKEKIERKLSGLVDRWGLTELELVRWNKKKKK